MGCACAKGNNEQELDYQKELSEQSNNNPNNILRSKRPNIIIKQSFDNDLNDELNKLLNEKFAVIDKEIAFEQITEEEFTEIIGQTPNYEKIFNELENEIKDIEYEIDVKYINIHPIKVSDSSGSTQYYKGCYNEYGQCHGQGIWVKDGYIYYGNFKNDLFNGQGLLISKDGNYIFGQWENGQCNGKSILNIDGLNTYEGQYKDNLKCGQGVEKFTDGTEYEGEFLDGERNGKGKIKYPDGNTYEGNFKNSKYEGIGELNLNNGTKYNGEFQEGKMNGKGIITWEDGTQFDGNFKDNKKSGKGEYKLPNKTTFNGCWDNNEIRGDGILDDPEKGTKKTLKYRYGKLISVN